jgi:hypothetical protein
METGKIKPAKSGKMKPALTPRRGGDAHTSRYTKCPSEETTAAVTSSEKVSDLKDFTREWRNGSSVCGEP